jgi:tetratricopeptide (TPR) repeat protein
MAIEIACAQAVMLDEYAGDMDGALKVLEAAQGKYPQDYRINRQRQKVYYRNGKHGLALAEFESFANAFPATSPVDRAFAMREAGRSAAEVGDLEKTRIFFEQAWESARKCGDHMRPLTAGLSADCAILDFQTGKSDSALILMLRALTEAELVDPKAGLKEHYCMLILMAAILWMRGAAANWPVERQAMVIGMCSNPSPPPELKDRPLPQRLLLWYELAELEAETSDSQCVLAALRQRTTKGGLLPMETTLASRLMQATLRNLDVDRFIDTLAIYPRAVVESIAIMANRRQYDVFAVPTGILKPIGVGEWNDKAIREATTSAILVFAATAVCSDRLDLFEDLRARLLNRKGLGPSVAPLFDMILARPTSVTTSLSWSRAPLAECCSRVSCSMPPKRLWPRSISSNCSPVMSWARQRPVRSANISFNSGATSSPTAASPFAIPLPQDRSSRPHFRRAPAIAQSSPILCLRPKLLFARTSAMS